ncbi:hypothetical protein FKP32DRAFT_1701098 [Trametes sanguinea]|nr:hypothetical protein FKP32DRAFT_1701098 [Trametes sanguinea]
MSTPMQRPTLTNVHIRSAADAHKLFYAVQLGLLPKIEKRLDANERAALRPGDVYVWEEKGPNTDSFSVSMERFTEGKSWTASRVREDFLMYFESPRKGKGNARTSENQVVRPGEQDLYIKLTYSVIREDVKEASQSKDADKLKKPPKWHMNAYFTKLTEGQLRTIDDIPMLRDLVVPEGIFSSARTSKPGKRGDSSRTANSTVKRMYAPFPPHPTRRVRSNDTPPPIPAPPGPNSAASASVTLNAAPDALLAPPPPLPAGSRRLSHSNSPSFSDCSSRSAPSPLHMSPALSSASTSSQDSPMLVAATPPLWDNGEPYKPAPMLPLSSSEDMHTPRVDLVPLETLPRSHVYRRSPTDDRALRLLALGPGAR